MLKCKKCNKIFKYRSLLERHENNKIPCNKEKELTECKICNINFPCSAKLERHNKTKKHINNYNIHVENMNITNNITTNVTNIINNTDELKQRLQQEYEDKLKEVIELKEDKLTKLQKENELLKFNFEEKIKINFDNEIEQELVPI